MSTELVRSARPTWERMKLKYVARLQYGDSLSAEARQDGAYQVYGSSGPVGTHCAPNTRGPAIVVGRKGSFGKVSYSAQPCFCIDTAYFVDSASTRADLRWLFYALQTIGLDGVSQDTGVPGLSREYAHETPIPAPPARVQRAIADFLDRKTAGIDALVEKKESLALTLAEKRQALIRRALTKGLDERVPTKPSGIASLGDIPRHWQVLSLRRIARVGQGDAFAHDLQGKDVGELPWFKVADMNRPGNELEMISAENFVHRRTATEATATIFPPGAVIFPRVGAALLTNKRRILVRPSIIDDNTYAVVPSSRVRSRFLYLSLLLVDMASISNAGLVPTVTFGAVKGLAIALPPVPEQDAIVRRIESDCSALDALVATTNHSVDRLREYRQALITAAVTGQLDVAAQEAA